MRESLSATVCQLMTIHKDDAANVYREIILHFVSPITKKRLFYNLSHFEERDKQFVDQFIQPHMALLCRKVQFTFARLNYTKPPNENQNELCGTYSVQNADGSVESVTNIVGDLNDLHTALSILQNHFQSKLIFGLNFK